MNGDGTVEVCQYRGNAGHVTIPENVQGYRVTGIDDIAFLNQRQVFRVQIPDSVTKIGRNAFRNCGIKTVVDEDLAGPIPPVPAGIWRRCSVTAMNIMKAG